MAYGLEKITSPEVPIYKQLMEYYRFCEYTCRMSSNTMAVKTGAINYFVDYTGIEKLEDINNQMIYEWVDHMASRGNTGRSINGRLQQLRVMLKWQRDDNVLMPDLKISRIVMQKEVPPRKVFFTREEINSALALADRREWLMIKLAFDCGLRISELRNLRLSDIHEKRMRIVGKCSKLRYVIMSDDARIRLDDWIQREGITDYLWPNKTNGKPICDYDMRKAMKKPFKAAGFNNFRPHDLRHSYATELKQLGVPTRQIQVGMGHSSEAITEKYLSDLDGFNVDEIYKVKYAVPELALR